MFVNYIIGDKTMACLTWMTGRCNIFFSARDEPAKNEAGLHKQCEQSADYYAESSADLIFAKPTITR